MTTPAENFRFGHTSEETALVVGDYPYGFRLRTTIRYWIETTKNGDRFVSQTQNPKIEDRVVWNKPKKSTYVEVGAIFIEEGTGHVKWTGLRVHDSAEKVEHFRTITDGNLSDAQKAKLARVIGLNKVFEKVTFKVEVNPHRTPEEQEAHEAKQAEINRQINRAAAVEVRGALEDLG